MPFKPAVSKKINLKFLWVNEESIQILLKWTCALTSSYNMPPDIKEEAGMGWQHHWVEC